MLTKRYPGYHKWRRQQTAPTKRVVRLHKACHSNTTVLSSQPVDVKSAKVVKKRRLFEDDCTKPGGKERRGDASAVLQSVVFAGSVNES